MTAGASHILVIKLGALGDFIQALGPMAAIRRHHPGAHITLLTTAPYVSFAQASGYFDTVWIDQKPAWHDLSAWIVLRKKLRSGNFSRVYDLQNNDRTSLYFKLFPAVKPEWVGIAKGASHRNDSPLRTQGHAFDGHVQTLAKAGVTNVTTDQLEWMNGDITPFKLQERFVLIVPGSSPGREDKRWPAEHYADVCAKLYAQGFQSVVLGSPGETELAQSIAHAAPGALNLAGRTTLMHIPALARKARGAIGNDTGPIHMIAATNCPCLVLFSGKSIPRKHAPHGAAVALLQKKDLSDLEPQTVLDAFKPR